LTHYQALTQEGISGAMIQYFDPSSDTLLIMGVLGQYLDLSLRIGGREVLDPLSFIAERIPNLLRLVVSDMRFPRFIHGPSLSVFNHLEELILLSLRCTGRIDSVSFIKTFEKDHADCPMETFWRACVPGLVKLFDKLEKTVVDWKAPKLRTGIFIKKGE
jgi:hypothetical protein